MTPLKILFLMAAVVLTARAGAQHEHHDVHAPAVDPQPLLAQAIRISQALDFLGSPLAEGDRDKLQALTRTAFTPNTALQVQKILDPYCLAIVTINPEARVSVERGAAPGRLTQGAWTTMLVKVVNLAGVTAPLAISSVNALSPVHSPSFEQRVRKEDVITSGQVQNRFLELAIYHNKPLLPTLSGLALEYQVLQIYSKDAGEREAELSFDAGSGSKDIGFRGSLPVLFRIDHPATVQLNIIDDGDSTAMAALYVTDSIDRMPGRLAKYYPLPGRRVAAFDRYPDFFFQKQIYRKSGETVELPAGRYHVAFTRGPEYVMQHRELTVPPATDSMEVTFELKKWINLQKLGWYSADHHVHAAGCSHYDSPEEGVPPAFMLRQSLGENLSIAAMLTWGPGWYHQKQNFTGSDDAVSQTDHLLHYDVEVSGFPSSHAGHVVLLNLREDDYPGTTTIEQWPSWTLPVLQWAHAQGSITGYAHSGWGLEPVTKTWGILNSVMPRMDGIGANEYIVTVAEHGVDFFSLGDTPPELELNMWYHTLNCGFRVSAAGETDFPCISDQRVGLCRTYFRSKGPVTYTDYITALKTGACYMSDGGSHLMDFTVKAKKTASQVNELNLAHPGEVEVTANVAAYLPENPPDSAALADVLTNVYWSIEHARLPGTRSVPLELIVNGVPVDTVIIKADGSMNPVRFHYRVERPCWLALRILSSSHSNPIFVTIGGKRVIEKASAEWCRRAVDQCWRMKSPNIRENERSAASAAYDHVRSVYDALIDEAAKRDESK